MAGGSGRSASERSTNPAGLFSLTAGKRSICFPPKQTLQCRDVPDMAASL